LFLSVNAGKREREREREKKKKKSRLIFENDFILRFPSYTGAPTTTSFGEREREREREREIVSLSFAPIVP